MSVGVRETRPVRTRVVPVVVGMVKVMVMVSVGERMVMARHHRPASERDQGRGGQDCVGGLKRPEEGRVMQDNRNGQRLVNGGH